MNEKVLDQRCDGPICNPEFTVKDEAIADQTINFISIRASETYSSYQWSIFIPPEGRNYYYCPRCTKKIMFRMGIT